LKEVLERAGLPHDLPPASEIRLQNVGVLAGPCKPALETAFKPMGYGCRGGSGGQYPICDAAQWQKIVENLRAIVRELDRSFVPEIEQAGGPSPVWYQPTF
jgi:hypothetical protein